MVTLKEEEEEEEEEGFGHKCSLLEHGTFDSVPKAVLGCGYQSGGKCNQVNGLKEVAGRTFSA